MEARNRVAGPTGVDGEFVSTENSNRERDNYRSISAA